jgi:hypothetical protein
VKRERRHASTKSSAAVVVLFTRADKDSEFVSEETYLLKPSTMRAKFIVSKGK